MHDPSLELFRGLMQDDPPYIPAYFMAAQQQARLTNLDLAKSFLREGIEQAPGVRGTRTQRQR